MTAASPITLARLTLPPLTPENAGPGAAAVLASARERIGMIPNMYRYMAQQPGVLETYAQGYGQFRSDSGFTSAEQEVVLLSISLENGCAYCIAAHSMLAAGPSGVPRDVVLALRQGRDGDDPGLAALARFTRTMVRERGFPPEDALASFLEAGFSERKVLAIILAISVKTISNYVNHIFDTPIDEPFREWAWTSGAATGDATPGPSAA